MPKCIVVTFGWTESPVIGSVVRHGLEPGDKIILLRPVDEDERSERAVNDLKTLIKSITGVELIEKRINISNFVGATATIKRILEMESEKHVIINLSGGMRILVLAAHLASLFTKNVELEVESENRKFRVTLPVINLNQLLKLKDNHISVLNTLQLFKGECLIKDLLNKMRFSRSTLYACIKDLRKMGLIEKTSGKRKIKITDKGILISILMRR